MAWLSHAPNPLGERLVGVPKEKAKVRAVRGATGEALFHVVRLPDGGVVVTSAETGIEPIIAFSDAKDAMVSEDSPLCDILALDLAARTEQIRRARSIKRAMSSGTADAIAEAESAWAVLLSSSKYGRLSISDMRVAPLLETTWGQGEDSNDRACANYYTPNGYICGCVALVGAQIARFWRFPTESRPSVNRTCYVSGRRRPFETMGGTYSWNDMPPTFSALSAEQREAIGKLCYDFGVATYMDWGPRGSGTGGFCLDDAFTTVFGYANSRVYVGEQGSAFSQSVIEQTVLANLDAGCPVALGLDGHEVVADGYGYASGTLFTHLNIGWNGDDDAWYHLPVVDGYAYRSTVLDEVVYNVFPEKTGDLLTGRVLDENGQPVAGAVVSTGEATTRTNGKGIWALWVDGGATWDVEARMGSLSNVRTVDVKRSVSSTVMEDSVWEKTGNPGNSWGNDIVLPGLMGTQPPPVFRFYSENYRGHFFTIDEKEKNDLVAHNPNWNYEGIAYRAHITAAPGTVPLHRFYSANYRGHFFTIDENEKNDIIAKNSRNWNYEGVAYYVYPKAVEGTVPVYRFWSARFRHHFYTIDENEKENIRARDRNWEFEGTAFWALPADATQNKTYAASSPAPKVATRANAASGVAERAFCPSGAETGGTPVPPFASWSLAARPEGETIAVPGETDLGDVFIETREDALDFADLWPHAENASGRVGFQPAEPSHAENAESAEKVPLRLAMPEGLFDAQLWSITDGLLLDEPVEGMFDFELPIDGAWRWLRVRDADDADAFTLWLRAE